MTELTRMQTIFLVLKHPKICIANSFVFQKLLLEKYMFSFQIEASHLHINPKWLCQPEISYTTLHFFQINTPTITLTLHCSSTMGGGLEKQSDFNTTSTSSSTSALAVSADWGIALPLWNVRVDTQYVGIIVEQKQQIEQLQEELAEFNRVQYRTLPANASRGKNEIIKEGEYDLTRPHKSASSSFLCKRSHLAWKQDASKELE
jgi:hypothetical protein